MSQELIRNFCIIAHIDHGKSTLADRLLQQTGTIAERDMREQLLDTMDLERERGITIKLQPVTMRYRPQSQIRIPNTEILNNIESIKSNPSNAFEIRNSKLDSTNSEFTLNLIDTPGHVDFTYEVSRSLAAVEGAILLVDAAQGIQAQTLTTLGQAQASGLTIIPTVNKIDLPNAEPERVAEELIELLGSHYEDIIFTSGKTGEGVPELLEAIVQRVRPPQGNPDAPLRALIFDSIYDQYRGVISSIRIVDGRLSKLDRVHFFATKHDDQALDVGIFSPTMTPAESLQIGSIGYIVTGVKDVSQARVGDTIVSNASIAEPLAGYKEIQPMVYAGLYTTDGEVKDLRDALGKLALNDSSLRYEPDSSAAFGLGFRCGFLGLLHLEIITERIRREYGIDLIVTTPSVAFKERLEGGKIIYSQPWVKAEILVPSQYLGPVMELAASRRGQYLGTDYLTTDQLHQRALLTYKIPLAAVIVDFYDVLKSVSSGYASLNYSLLGYEEDPKLVRLDILVAGDSVEELGRVVHRDDAFHLGQALVSKLKELIPRQAFEVILQAAVGGRIIARDTIGALRKDVTAKLYGGDRTRKDKLLKKQAEGKKRMKKLGKVDIPTDVFIKLLR